MEKLSFNEEEKDAARALLAALEPFRALRPTMPLQYVYLFLTVVAKEGQTVTEYAEKAGVPQTVMTRHLLEIGHRKRSKQEGLGLVTQKADINDLRKHRAYITTLGKSTMNKVINALYSVRRK
jgi:DNA-binding MarR family transcriptional regulator